MATTINPYQMAARLKKSGGLTALAISYGLSSTDLGYMDNAQWAELAKAAGEYMPSAETRRMVIDQVAASARNASLDPLRGFDEPRPVARVSCASCLGTGLIAAVVTSVRRHNDDAVMERCFDCCGTGRAA